MQELVVWWARPDASARTARLLSPDERTRRTGLRRAEDRARFTSARLLLRMVVAERCGVAPDAVLVHSRCDRCGGPHGRPFVTLPDGPGPHVSLAHAGDRVVAAVGDHPLGVDVEPERGARPGLADVALAPVEAQRLRGLDTDAATSCVLRSWVRKEAILKAVGRGLDVDPGHVVVGGPTGAPRLEAWLADDPPGPIGLHDLDLADPPGAGGYVAALAVLGDAPTSVLVRAASLSDAAW